MPVFDVRLTPVPPDPVTLVLARFTERLELPMLMPIPAGLLMVVEPLVKLPPIEVKVIPVVALVVEEILANVPFKVPVERFSARPVPFNVTSETLSVPMLAPSISVPELPPVNPRNVLF